METIKKEETKVAEEKFYIGSDGTKKSIKEMETTYLSNAYAKKYRELYNSTTKEEFSKRLQEINDLKEEMFGRVNNFYDTLGE